MEMLVLVQPTIPTMRPKAPVLQDIMEDYAQNVKEIIYGPLLSIARSVPKLGRTFFSL